MELLVTIAYFCLVWLVFFRFKLLRFNLFWSFIVFGLYAGAALTEVILLGQTTPYSKTLMVERYVVPLAPAFGGLVADVYVKPNTPIKAGTPIFAIDTTPWQHKLEKAEQQLAQAQAEKQSVQAQLAEAERRLADAEKLVPKQLMAAQELDIRTDRAKALTAQVQGVEKKIGALAAELAEAQYNLQHATIVAPFDGYVVNLQLRKGGFVRLKQPVVTFVSSEELYLLASVDQRAGQWIRSGDEADFALSIYPGEIFHAKVEAVIWATGRAQFQPSGALPREETITPSNVFHVRLTPVGDFSEHPLHFGARGITAIFTNKAIDLVKVLRRIELQSESFLNYIYNPF
ncbi:MAG: efflux RND transporter periplasmic adaptor subunit [Thiohalocapsa sp.]|jgi:multidrug resistance efflux pump|uniref:HlyD family secretion protein n=1 Tax=Thiohalocapsa sp. TaxID=2497641 RepID=UPI0025D9A941|nr:efflux RND transporter periplasmic adaptor subunit [Thiohalocapsa sp.]MCG6943276.1 efflux RND transporter periplasmic adaptor subunit [Thiohalocapsa sp.]